MSYLDDSTTAGAGPQQRPCSAAIVTECETLLPLATNDPGAHGSRSEAGGQGRCDGEQPALGGAIHGKGFAEASWNFRAAPRRYIRAVGERGVNNPEAEPVNEPTSSSNQTTQERPRRSASTPQARQRQSLYRFARPGSSGSQQPRTVARSDKAPRSHHVARNGSQGYRPGIARRSTKPLPAELRSRLAGDRENSRRLEAVSSGGRGGRSSCRSSANRKPAVAGRAPIVTVVEFGPEPPSESRSTGSRANGESND